MKRFVVAKCIAPASCAQSCTVGNSPTVRARYSDTLKISQYFVLSSCRACGTNRSERHGHRNFTIAELAASAEDGLPSISPFRLRTCHLP